LHAHSVDDDCNFHRSRSASLKGFRFAQDDSFFLSHGGHFMKLGLVISAIFLLASVVAGFTQTSTAVKALTPLEHTLIASEQSLIEAKKKDDDAFFKQRVSENFAFVEVDGELHEGQEAVDELGDSSLVELTPYDIKVVMVGDGAAIVTYDAIVRQAPQEDQGPPPRYQHFSSVWVKQGDAWKLKFHQSTPTHWGDW
jgi:hypothetical protein